MLNLVYFSNITENTHRFIEKLDWVGNVTRIPVLGALETPPEAPYVLITPTYGSMRSGHVPRQVKRFLHNPENIERLVGVIGAGNINFGEEYALAGDLIANKFNIPLLYRFELAGTANDITRVSEGLQQFEQSLINQPV